ncbi:MAG: hypothetical protein ONB05_09330 [candidate division KSB1 bacterium]|nr:hypothetical protein [candidate division KSB1 bacterium]
MKMKRVGNIVRLIDIVLNLLFGFMCISELDRKSGIRLAESTDMVISKIDKEQILVVGVLSDSAYVIENKLDPKTQQPIVIAGFEPLKQFIKEQDAEFQKLGKKMKVRIRSNWYMPIKYTMRIADFCQQEGIPKGLDVRVVEARK